MEKYQTGDGLRIDIKRLFVALWQQIWLVILVGALLGAVLFGYAYLFITPTYSSSVQMYVNNNYADSPGFSSSQLTAAQDLADTYMVILKSRSVLEQVREETNLGYSYNQVRDMVTTAAVNETEVFQVTVTCANYKHAAAIANAIAAVLPQRIAEVVEGSSVRVVDYAVENPNPVGPNHTRYAIAGVLLGMLLTACVIVVRDILDTSIVSEDYLTTTYGDVPLLAVIPGVEGHKGGYYKGYYKGYYEAHPKAQTEEENGGAQ